MAEFEKAVEDVLRWEGGLVNDPDDPGGLTKYGISKRSYSHLNIAELTVDDAKEIYRRDWWDCYHYGEIESQAVANKLLLFSINTGAERAHRYFQKVLNYLLPRKEQLETDGIFGSLTMKATNSLNADDILIELKVRCAFYYAVLVLRKPARFKFLLGWLRRAIS
jgi:lysozyme family protein